MPLYQTQRTVLTTSALAVLLLYPLGTKAANPSNYFYGISETGVWNTNPLMLRRNAETIYGSETKAFFGLKNETPTSKIRTEASILRNQMNQSVFNTTDIYLKAYLEKSFKRWMMAFNGAYDYDTTRSSEITTFGQDIGTGRRNSFSLQPSVSYMISPRTFFGLSGRWLETRYEEDTLVDYRIYALTPSLGYNITPIQTVSLSFQSQRYDLLEDTDRYIDSLGPNLAWQYKISPTLTLDLSGGYLGSKINGYSGVESTWEYNVVYGMTLSHSTPRNTASMGATRSRQPYSDGTESYLTTLDFKDQYKVNDKLFLNLKANYQFSKQPPQATNSLDTAMGGEVGLTYKFARNWTATSSYKYRSEELTSTKDEAEQQIIRLGITYRFGSGE